MAESPGPWSLHGRVVTPDGVVDGYLVVDGERIVEVVPGGPGAARAAVDAADLGLTEPLTILPGLVDLHCHGGGGAGFPDATEPEVAITVATEHLRHGTTSLVASLVTDAPENLLERVAVLAPLAEAGQLAGIHVEGPFLSPARCGAQEPSLMTSGDVGLVRELVSAANGQITALTAAPEVQGVLGVGGVFEAIVAAGIVPSIGHTDATAEVVDHAVAEARRLLGHGGRSPRPLAAHLFNGMRPLHHRDPGPVAALLAAAGRGDVVVELIADGVHLAPGTVRAVMELVGPDAVALVTDAMAGAGMPDGFYRLGPARVQVTDGLARLARGGAIAGGTAHLLDVVRATVSAGVPLADAVRSAATTPASVLGRPDIGALEAGRRADLVVVDADLRPLRVMRAGTWLT
ncbi:MAG: amidohydrolase family protein [Actinomycetales bacterium]|nr:amidohydrolase family protein [Actinomycetales bacterium]